MLGSQSTAGDRNEVWDLGWPRSPKSLGAVEWINDPHAQGVGRRGWGTPRCVGTPPPSFQGHLPLPRGSQRAPQHSHSPAGDRRASAPTPPPRARAAPKDRAGAGAVARGREERTHRSRGRRRSPHARRPPRCPLGSSPRSWRRSAAPPRHPPSSPPNLRLESRNRAAAGRKEGEFPGPKRQGPRALPWRIQGSGVMTFRSPRTPGSQPTAPLLSHREVRGPSHLLSQDPGHGAPTHLHSHI